MAPIGSAVFATLLMNDGYLPGAMVLGHSLKDKGAKAKLVALVVMDQLAGTTITELQTVYDEIVPVSQIVNRMPANLYLMDRPDLVAAFTKIELWRQTQYKRIVYIDADVVALRAPNELLTMDTKFAAVPDIGWPDCFNSGLLVLNPSMAEYCSLLALAERGVSFDGADQGLLNMHFTDWERLSFKYNCTPSGNYQYVPAYRHFQSGISLVHFIGKDKPWTLGRNSRLASGIYGELLARWWAVYDGHYRSQEVIYHDGQYQLAPRKVQDYVSGEETIYLPSSQRPAQSFQQFQKPQGDQPVPTMVIQSPSGDQESAMERPMGDQPAVEEQIQKHEYTPTPTQEQRRWTAPHVEWDPARSAPPTNSKPEAQNFPAIVYQMSHSRDLFQPPSEYPEAPKDMWYQVPEKATIPSKPKEIFPWEARARRPTRVFAEPRLPSPPPEPTLPPAQPVDTPELTELLPQAVNQPGEPSAVEQRRRSFEAPAPPPPTTWETFNQRTNAWDDMPEITAYMQAFHPPKKGPVQVIHHQPSSTVPSAVVTSPPLQRQRRESVKVTDFPTAVERPSLPVTPAPVGRPTMWGDDKEDEGILPTAAGVPKQDQWVRRFSSYHTPEFASLPPFFQEVNGVLCMRCQHCGKQNPVAQLEELQRRQSEILLNQQMKLATEAPKRELPESRSKEDVIEATEKAVSPSAGKTPLKPILKEPKFELSLADRSEKGLDGSAGDSVNPGQVLSPRSQPSQPGISGPAESMGAANQPSGGLEGILDRDKQSAGVLAAAEQEQSLSTSRETAENTKEAFHSADGSLEGAADSSQTDSTTTKSVVSSSTNETQKIESDRARGGVERLIGQSGVAGDISGVTYSLEDAAERTAQSSQSLHTVRGSKFSSSTKGAETFEFDQTRGAVERRSGGFGAAGDISGASYSLEDALERTTEFSQSHDAAARSAFSSTVGETVSSESGALQSFGDSHGKGASRTGLISETSYGVEDNSERTVDSSRSLNTSTRSTFSSSANEGISPGSSTVRGTTQSFSGRSGSEETFNQSSGSLDSELQRTINSSRFFDSARQSAFSGSMGNTRQETSRTWQSTDVAGGMPSSFSFSSMGIEPRQLNENAFTQSTSSHSGAGVTSQSYSGSEVSSSKVQEIVESQQDELGQGAQERKASMAGSDNSGWGEFD